MRPSHHAAASALVAGGVWGWTASGWLAALAWIVGVFVDVDHLIDFLMSERSFPASTRGFLDHFLVKRRFRKVVIIFHAYEWMGLAWFVAWWHWPSPWGVVAALAYSQHLVLDAVANRHLHPLCYFLVFRVRCGFSREVLLPGTRSTSS